MILVVIIFVILIIWDISIFVRLSITRICVLTESEDLCLLHVLTAYEWKAVEERHLINMQRSANALERPIRITVAKVNRRKVPEITDFTKPYQCDAATRNAVIIGKLISKKTIFPEDI